MLDFGLDICADPRLSTEHEWLVTNGIGGYASGTVGGPLTRRYHGLLIAALQPPVGRTLLLTKLDETATCNGVAYPLFADRWTDGRIEPQGYQHMVRFRLEGTVPMWTFVLPGVHLEKRVWMEQGANTTYIQYKYTRGSGPVQLSISAIVNHRDHHGHTRSGDWQARVDPMPHGLRLMVGGEVAPLYLLSDRAQAAPRHRWTTGYFLSVEHYRGQNALDDNLCAGSFAAALQPGESLTLVASTGSVPALDGIAARARQQAHECSVRVDARPHLEPMTPEVEQLALAADQFIVRRSLPGEPEGRSVIAGYPWFGDWGRDTMISLPGLALATGRNQLAARILRTFAHFVDRGMLPNRFPDEGQAPEYNTVDATLWYFEAIRAYHEASRNDVLLRDLFSVLQEIVDWHVRGTRHQIHVDPDDGLLYAGEPGVQLTWMDAKVDDWVVTPRIGKPVEINALWYNALRIMADFAHMIGESFADIPPRSSARHGRQSDAPSSLREAWIQQPESLVDHYNTLADRVRASFSRFWNADAGYCYDVIDGPDGDDPSLRPNQLFAASLPHSPLSPEQKKAVVDVCNRHLVTPHGLRSLAPSDLAYVGHYGGDRRTRDAAYHQGTVWGWLIGPFVSAHLRVYHDPATARSFLFPLLQQVASHGLGSLSEIFDGNLPHTPRGCIAQAWTVAEVLRTWKETKEASS